MQIKFQTLSPSRANPQPFHVQSPREKKVKGASRVASRLDQARHLCIRHNMLRFFLYDRIPANESAGND